MMALFGFFSTAVLCRSEELFDISERQICMFYACPPTFQPRIAGWTNRRDELEGPEDRRIDHGQFVTLPMRSWTRTMLSRPRNAPLCPRHALEFNRFSLLPEAPHSVSRRFPWHRSVSNTRRSCEWINELSRNFLHIFTVATPWTNHNYSMTEEIDVLTCCQQGDHHGCWFPRPGQEQDRSEGP